MQCIDNVSDFLCGSSVFHRLPKLRDAYDARYASFIGDGPGLELHAKRLVERFLHGYIGSQDLARTAHHLSYFPLSATPRFRTGQMDSILHRESFVDRVAFAASLK